MKNLIKGLSAAGDAIGYVMVNGLLLGVPAFILLKAVQYVAEES